MQNQIDAERLKIMERIREEKITKCQNVRLLIQKKN